MNPEDDAAEDALLDRLMDGLPPAPEDNLETRAAYERLIALLRELPPTAPRAGWEERVERRRLEEGDDEEA